MLKISEMSGKLEDIPALNTDTTSNEFCLMMSKRKGTICERCYSMRMLKTFRRMCVPRFRHNAEELSRPLEQWELIRTEPGVFRVNAHGEFDEPIQFHNVMRIIHINPKTFFAVWTKRKDYVKKWLAQYDKPENCNFIYSNPLIDVDCKLPEGFDKVFNVRESRVNKINCQGKCKDCLVCYRKNDVKQIYEVVK